MNHILSDKLESMEKFKPPQDSMINPWATPSGLSESK